MRPNNGAIKLVAGNSNPALADAIAAYLATPLTKAVVRRFADMEIFVEIQENVRGSDVFVIQSTSFPANDHLMELLIIIDALRRASGRRITAVARECQRPPRPRGSGRRHAPTRGPRIDSSQPYLLSSRGLMLPSMTSLSRPLSSRAVRWMAINSGSIRRH